MGDNKTKQRSGFADAVLAFNSAQMKLQRQPQPKKQTSFFINHSTGNDARAYGVDATDILFYYSKPHIGRAGAQPATVPTNPEVHSALTGLQTLPGRFQNGIVETMNEHGMSEDMLNLSILASITIVGIALFDLGLEEAATKETMMTVQISGIVTAVAYEKMVVGRHVCASIPPKSAFESRGWNRGEGRSTGKITLVPRMQTQRDVTSFSLTLMREYIYNGGQRALALMRKSANYNMFANFCATQKEFALFCGIMFDYVMRERGFSATPTATNNDIVDAVTATREVGSDLGVPRSVDGIEAFGPDLAGNFGRIYYPRVTPVVRAAAIADVGAGGDPDQHELLGITEHTPVALPAEAAVFHGLMTGLLDDPAALPNAEAPPANAQFLQRAVQHVSHVLSNDEFARDRAAYYAAIDRFNKLVFTNRADGMAVQEFGVKQFGPRRGENVARTVIDDPRFGIANPTDDYFGRLLLLQKHAYSSNINAIENLFNFNDGLRLGRITSGGEKGNTFQFYYNL